MEKKEKEGIIFTIITIFLAGSLPIVVKYGAGIIHPLFFATISSLIAGGCLFTVTLIKGNWKILLDIRYLFYFLIIGFFGITLSNVLFFYGVTVTSGINSAILLQIEPLYALFIGYIFLDERITLKQIIFTLVIILGTLTVLYKGSFKVNWGDGLVLFTPMCWQVAHFQSKRLMAKNKAITPLIIATARTVYGGIFLFIINYIWGVNQFNKLIGPKILFIIFFQGIIGFALQYSIWYEAVKRINLSKATTIVSVYPVFSIILAWFVLKEIPAMNQLAGFGLILVGIISLSGIKSEQREKRVILNN
ncbi:MAG: DMT family transporter [Candidatus Atribacteria bacterium]